MSDDKMIKAALEAQKALRSAPHAEAMEAASRASRQLGEALREIEKSGVGRLLDRIKEHEALTRASIGPIWELKHSRIFDFDSPWRRDLESARQAMEAYKARFQLPEGRAA
jgi:hypothetical protein